MLGTLVVLGISIAYLFPALAAPFPGGHDTYAHLLPVLHYRRSILMEGAFPWFTDLWYGGRPQWMNPLSTFLYPPATIVWLALPLETGTKVLLLGHTIGALFAARRLARCFVDRELDAVALAILFCSSLPPAMRLGHVEKIFPLPWVLLGLFFLLKSSDRTFREGIMAGLCLCLIPLAGANYYALYAGILFAAVLLARRSRPLTGGVLLGVVPGLFHVPSILHLIGVPRLNASETIGAFSSSPLVLVNDLFLGRYAEGRLEGLSIIGLPTLALLISGCEQLYRRGRSPENEAEQWSAFRVAVALLAAAGVLALLATGALYRGHHILDTFRVPCRATAFLAVTILLFVCVCMRHYPLSISPRARASLLVTAVAHVALVLLSIQPPGDSYDADSSGAGRLAASLVARNAKSVWLSTFDLDQDTLIPFALTRAGLALPNVYYGDMGQTVPLRGPYCGFSFDYLLRDGDPTLPEPMFLINDITGRSEGAIPAVNLRHEGSETVLDREWQIYRVVCDAAIKRRLP